MQAPLPISLLIGLLLVIGLFVALRVSRLGLPRIIAYLAVGMLFSPELLGRLSGFELTGWSDQLTSFALALIAFLIGGSITIQQLRRMGKVIFSSAMGASLGAIVFVFLVIYTLAPLASSTDNWLIALALAAISASTAPAGTVAIIHQYRAKGPVTSTLLGAVAIDDAIGIAAFSIILAMISGESLGEGVLHIVHELGLAVVIGIIAARLLASFSHRVHQGNLRLPMIFGFILLLQGSAQWWHFSPLMAIMTMGFFLRYFLHAAADRMFASIEYFEELIFVIFFTLAGAHFDFSVFSQNLLLISGYVLARVSGKIIGAYLGARIGNAPKMIRLWLGPSLIPQAGIAVGLGLIIIQTPQLSHLNVLLMNTIIASTIIYELLGPLVVKFALNRSGELNERRGR